MSINCGEKDTFIFSRYVGKKSRYVWVHFEKKAYHNIKERCRTGKSVTFPLSMDCYTTGSRTVSYLGVPALQADGRYSLITIKLL